MNPVKRKRIRKFTLEEVIEKVTDIDSDNENLAADRGHWVMLAEKIRLIKITLFQRCQDVNWRAYKLPLTRPTTMNVNRYFFETFYQMLFVVLQINGPKAR